MSSDSSVTTEWEEPPRQRKPTQEEARTVLAAQPRGPEMEYYYCPSLLKLLRYLWVSGHLDPDLLFLTLPPPAKFAFWLSAASGVSVFFKKWWLCEGGGSVGERDWGLVWEAGQARRSRES